MSNNQAPLSFEQIDEMAEGDVDFRAELIVALYKSLSELKEKYLEGAELQDMEMLSQVRHKIKPALALFEIHSLNETIQTGKEILLAQGFGEGFIQHLDQFIDLVDEAISAVETELGRIEGE